MITMTDILICLKSLLILSVAWFTELMIFNFAQLSIIGPNLREFFIETKEIINWVVSVLVLILTVVKLRREHINKKEGKKSDD